MSSLDGALRKGKRAGLELCVASNPYSGSEGATHSVDSRIAIARVRGTARYASAIAGGADVFAVCGGRFAHAHYRFRKRALLVPSRCDSIAQ